MMDIRAQLIRLEKYLRIVSPEPIIICMRSQEIPLFFRESLLLSEDKSHE
jgi:hypothetical protein